ncbi:MAG: acyl carrier protein [Candidatus Rokuibacteriota bacterium]
MTSSTAIAEKIRSSLARELKRDPQTITLDQTLREDLGLNSLDAIELMFKVEEEFDIEIPDPDLQKLRTVGDLVSYLEARVSGSAVPAPAAVPEKPVTLPPSPRAATSPKSKADRTAPRPTKPAAKRSRA